MKVRILNGTAPVDRKLQAHVARRLDFALSSFSERIGRVVVRFSSAEMPGARPLKRCEIEVVMRARSVSVADAGADLFTAVENAADRLKRSIVRALERERIWGAAAASPPRSNRAVAKTVGKTAAKSGAKTVVKTAAKTAAKKEKVSRPHR